ncbi:MAG: hypothetical protein JJE17_07440 [Peptostreptococcaceae bacterium]|nr:hypothetical protein [Peptostreptococcaceae bacterium]
MIDKSNNQELLIKEKNIDTLKILEIGINVLPWVGGIASGCLGLYSDSIQRKRLEFLFEKLNKKIDFQKIQDDYNSLSNMINVFNLVIKTKRKEKIICYANLLSNGYVSELLSLDGDEFEDNMNILENLTYEDIILLESLRNNALNLPSDLGGITNFNEMLNDMISKISNELKKSIEIIISNLDKLCGKGVCTKITYQSFVFGTSKTNEHYQISPIYKELRALILSKD